MVDMSKCVDCGEKFSNDTNLKWHKEKSAACRLKRATNRILEHIRANQPLPQGPVVEDAPLGEFDEPSEFEILEDNDPPEESEDDNGRQIPNETAARKRIFDSCKQVAAFIKRNRLSNQQTDEMLNLWKDDRLRIREVLETFNSHRDVDKYLMSQLVGEVRRNITRLMLFSRLVSGSAYCCPKPDFNLHAPFVQEHHSAHPSCLELHCG
jgi:Zn ribbon nucleic-acid-binding protein